jgi:hypothetical protein
MAIRDKRKARNQKASRFSFTPETIRNVEQILAELVLGVSEGAATEIPENWLLGFIRGTGMGS